MSFCRTASALGAAVLLCSGAGCAPTENPSRGNVHLLSGQGSADLTADYAPVGGAAAASGSQTYSWVSTGGTAGALAGASGTAGRGGSPASSGAGGGAAIAGSGGAAIAGSGGAAIAGSGGAAIAGSGGAVIAGSGAGGSSGTPDAGTADQGSLGVRFTTVDQGGRYEPCNIGAVWIERADGTFVKTLERWAGIRARYLGRWTSASGGWPNTADQVDAVSRATLRSHATHQLSWTLHDTSGAVVPDGDYRVLVELTDQDSAGPWSAVAFQKGPSGVQLTPADQAPYTGFTLIYSP